MVSKKIKMSPKNLDAVEPVALDEWVIKGGTQDEPETSVRQIQESDSKLEPKSDKESDKEKVKMKRLTLDLPKPLHKAIKAKAVDQGVPMADLLRSLLEKHFGAR
jgi:predicted DNA binding CopG/RHH family protein